METLYRGDMRISLECGGLTPLSSRAERATMPSQADEQLSDDHRAVNEVLQQLLAALSNNDVRSSYEYLDLLWARLAVHIRAEHLHLFPTVMNRLAEPVSDAAGSRFEEAQTMIENLREDHDFFMRELAGAIAVLRDISATTTTENNESKLAKIADTVRAIEKRLISHNEIEENHVYRWASTILTEREQRELSSRISAELENRPQRFSVETWSNFR
jgi:hemerythrin superfamily protein